MLLLFLDQKTVFWRRLTFSAIFQYIFVDTPVHAEPCGSSILYTSLNIKLFCSEPEQNIVKERLCIRAIWYSIGLLARVQEKDILTITFRGDRAHETKK